MMGMKTNFRFETLEVWRRSTDLSMQVFQLADELERQKQFRFAEQLRAAMLSITNNLAEGSGSSSKREFSQFVNISRRSLFEVVNMLLIFSRHGLVDRERIEPWLAELEELSKMLEALRKKLSSVMTQLLALLMPLLSFGA